MIESFKHKGLKELFEKGRTAKIDKRYQDRCKEVLDVIHRSANTTQMALPGYFLHPLKQYDPWIWSIWITGSRRITFEFKDGNAKHVDFEQYH